MNTMKKTIVALLVLAVLLMAFVGCGKEEKSLQGTAKTQGFPVIITDSVEREVTIPDKAERITSGYYISTYSLLNLGLKDQIVGIESKANTRGVYKLFAPELLSVPDVGTAKAVNVETIMSLKPDLVVLPYQQAETADKFEQLGVPTLVVKPETMQDFLYVLDILSKATGTSQRAATLINWYKTAWAELESKTSRLQQKSVYLCSNSDPLNALTAKMFQAEIIKAAGGKLVTADIEGAYWTKVSMEQLFVYQPEFMLISSGGDMTPQSLLADSNWKKLMKSEQNVFGFPSAVDGWDNPTLSSVLGAYYMANKLHPEAVTKDDVINKAKEFYKLAFKEDVTAEQLGL
ncbi:MAG: ABC transporter substrate-binding protein [Candidatus Humimicrobiaceae bacterium]